MPTQKQYDYILSLLYNKVKQLNYLFV